MSGDPDLQDIRRSAQGDRVAQASLVHRHMPRIHAVAVRMLGDRTAAEDIVQDAFIRAWKVMPNWQPNARFSTWLHRVTLNLCYDQLRKRREITGLDLPEMEDRALTPDEAVDQSQRIERIHAAMSRLPDRQRAALVLCRLEGHTYRDAAQIMDVSAEALESLLARARRSLKQALREDEEPGHG